MMHLRYPPSTYSIHKSMPERLPYVVESMTLADVDQVMDIEYLSFSTPWSARAYRYEIAENDHSTMLVVRPRTAPGGRLVQLTRQFGLVKPGPVLGYAGFWLLVDDAHICTIAVHPQWRGQGLGEMLMISLLDRGMELDALRATLEVRVSNRAAQKLYRKYGFEIVSRRKRYYSDNNEDAYIMTTPPFETSAFQMNLNHCRAQLHTRLQSGGEGLSQADSITILAQDQ
jgi:ribosomal-protein-alanine N-acetyltransferase